MIAPSVLVGPGERYDIVWTAHNPGGGRSAATLTITSPNDGAEVDGGGGMTMIIDVAHLKPARSMCEVLLRMRGPVKPAAVARHPRADQADEIGLSHRSTGLSWSS
jgi:hypothetical protein